MTHLLHRLCLWTFCNNLNTACI